MIIKDFKITLAKSQQSANLYVLPDCHFGSPAFLEHEYERLAQIIENDPNAYVIFQGDITDACRPSSRKAKKIAYHDRKEEHEMESDRDYWWLDEKVIPKLKRLIGNKDRCIGMMDGDHYMRMANGLSSTQYLAAKMKVPYLGDGQAIIRLRFHAANSRPSPIKTISMHVQHGIGGGGREGTGVNKLADTCNNWDGIEVFVRGHSHKGFIFPVSKYYVPLQTNHIKQRDIWLVNTPSFRTGFIVGRTDYAEQRNYGATAHKFPVLKFTCIKSRKLNCNSDVVISGELL